MIDRARLNDALSMALMMIGFTDLDDDNLNELTHRTADFLENIGSEL